MQSNSQNQTESPWIARLKKPSVVRQIRTWNKTLLVVTGILWAWHSIAYSSMDGKVENGRYYLGYKRNMREVSREEYYKVTISGILISYSCIGSIAALIFFERGYYRLGDREDDASNGN